MSPNYKKKKAEVERFKERLADAEKQSEVKKNELEKDIKILVEEQKDLKCRVTKLLGDQEKKKIESRELILALRENLIKTKNEEIERTKELCDLKVEYADAKAEIANQRTQIVEQQLQIEKNSLQQLQNQLDALRIFK